MGRSAETMFLPRGRYPFNVPYYCHRALMSTQTPVPSSSAPLKSQGLVMDPSPVKEVFRQVLPVLWPSDRFDLRGRVALAMGCLISSKLLNVRVPIIFKHIVNDMSQCADASSIAAGAVAVPTVMILGYGCTRAAASLTNEARNGIFSRVSQQALRTISTSTFAHLHNLDLRFHLSRSTGALPRIVDRGTRGLNFVISSVLF